MNDSEIIAEHEAIEWHDGASRSRRASVSESMDVLLQLTLPIVLILALLASQQVNALRDEMATLEARRAPGDEADLEQQLERSVLDLQHQILLKASEEAAASLAADLGLERYEAARPESSAIAGERVTAEFKTISSGLAEAFNGPRARRRSASELTSRALVHFDRSARDLLAADSGGKSIRSRRLLHISQTNRDLLQKAVEARLVGLEAEGAKVQLRMLEDWLASPTSGELEARSRGAWSRVLEGEESEFRTFLNLKVRDLVQRLDDQGVPLLETTIERAL